MSTTESQSDRRDKAIKKFNERVDTANRKAAEREANIRTQEERRKKLQEDWPRIADGVITSSVIAVSDGFIQHGSPIYFTAATVASTIMPTAPRNFDARHKGQSQPLGRLQFEVDLSTGKIIVTSNLKVVDLPQPILLSDFEPEWASKAAEAMLLTILES